MRLPAILSSYHTILHPESRRNEVGVVIRDSDGRESQRVSESSSKKMTLEWELDYILTHIPRIERQN
jgi:hypothetical protein